MILRHRPGTRAFRSATPPNAGSRADQQSQADTQTNRPADRPPTEGDRGRGAEQPTEIPRKGWRDVLKRTKNELNNDHVSIISAGVAFYLLMGLIPGLAALISIYGLIADPKQIEQQFAAISGFLPTEVTSLLEQQMKRIASSAGTASWAAVVSILVALWGGSAATKAVIQGLNIAYNEGEKRGFVKLTLASLGLTLAAVILGIVAIGAIVALPALLKFAGLEDNADLVANIIRWPLLAVLAVCTLAVLYRFAPSRDHPRWRWVTWGSTVAMILWVIGSAAFSFYAANFGSYNKTYGSLGAVVILLMWLYLSAYVVMLGAELNSEMEHQTARDTTRGPEEPMGRRRAHVADDLGQAPA